MSTKLSPTTLRDFHGGRYSLATISNYLTPEYTVSDSLNVNFETIIGSAVVRKGTTKLGNTVAQTTPLGATNYISSKGTAYNRLIVANAGASNATAYYFQGAGAWTASNLTNLSKTARCRFDMLGNQLFIVNGKQIMKSSSDGGATWVTTNCIDSSGNILPSLIIRAKARLLLSGDSNSSSGSPSRVWFSNVVVPGNPGTVTYNTNATTGFFIDINPDDGDAVTGFANTSTYTLAFKNRAMYRIDVINTSVDSDNIFNIGAPSQEAITTVQGITYFFSGLDIRSTTGDFPQQISRLGVQDYIDAIPQANWTSVYAGNDGVNPYFAIGSVTLNTNQDNQKTYTNVILKFSPKDQSWSVHGYGSTFQAFTNIATTSLVGYSLIGSDTGGAVQVLNKGGSDNTVGIFYELITNELDFGDRSHQKTISGDLAFFTKFGNDSSIQLLPDDDDNSVIALTQNLNKRVTIAQNVNCSFKFLKFRWFGNTVTNQPQFSGLHIESLVDDGLI